ncbi:MAG: hypothetical protein RIG62_16815 [Cyclobacteriaceae bacterium]
MNTKLYQTNNFKELIQVFKMRVLCWENISKVDSRDYPHGMIEEHDYSPDAFHYIMRNESEIIGGARLKICHELEEIPDYEVYESRNIPFKWPVAHLGKLIVLPKYHGQGFSQEFDKIRYKKSKELGAKMILGWTHIQSKRLWHKLNSDGFRSSGLINSENYTGTWELGNGEIIYKHI